MEAILPNDMMREVMKYLTHNELAIYGQSSKTSLQSSEDEWKVRYNQLRGEKKENKDANPLVYWMINYSVNVREQFRLRLMGKMALFDNEDHKQERKSIICEMFDDMIENSFIFSGNKKFKQFRKNVDQKLEEFLNGNEVECAIAEKYYPVLFPLNYVIAMKEKEKRDQELDQELENYINSHGPMNADYDYDDEWDGEDGDEDGDEGGGEGGEGPDAFFSGDEDDEPMFGTTLSDE